MSRALLSCGGSSSSGSLARRVSAAAGGAAALLAASARYSTNTTSPATLPPSHVHTNTTNMISNFNRSSKSVVVSRSHSTCMQASPLTVARRHITKHASEMSTPDRATVGSANKKEFITPLCQELINRSLAQGYYTQSQFIKDCLTHPQYGYYAAKKNVIGGDKADFITSAEIPLFGDVIAAWVQDAWQKMGTPRVIHLVELGPGRGSLMRTILAQIQYSNPSLFHFLRVHLIEVGAARQEEQKKALKDFQTSDGKIKWWMSAESVPTQNEAAIFISNEYFDALPVAQFRYTERGWVETCLEIDDDPAHEAHFKLVHAPSGTISAYLIPDDVRASGKLGDCIEVNAAGMEQMEFLMRKMVDCTRSACLIIDYGKDEHMQSTLRGIRGHRFVDPLLSPGEVDLSCWVSFKQLRWVLERLELARRHLKWFPVMTQRAFLEQNGIDVRLTHVIKDEETKSAMKILQNYNRLMDPEEMGQSYKVFAVQTRNFPNVAPFFEEMPLPPLRETRHVDKKR